MRARSTTSPSRPAAARSHGPGAPVHGSGLRSGASAAPASQPELEIEDLATLQRLAGNGAIASLLSAGRASAAQVDGGPHHSASELPTVQRGGGDDDEAAYSFRIPDAMSFAINMSDWRSISFEAITSLNDDQLLDLKHQMDTWRFLYENVPDLLHDDYKKARGAAKRQQAYELFMDSAKILRAFKRRYGPVTERAAKIARGRGFSIPGATFGPKDEHGAEYDRWVREISGGLSDRAAQVFGAVLPEVKSRLEFLLWDIDYPTPGKGSRSYWQRYGYWTASVIQQVLTTDIRRTEWDDFAPHLSNAAAPIAAAFANAVQSAGEPADVIRQIEAVTGQVTEGFNEILRQADGVIGHGIEDVNIRDLYRLAQQMRDRSGSVMGCYADGFLYG